MGLQLLCVQRGGTMWIITFLVTLICLSQTQAGGRGSANRDKNKVTHDPLPPDSRGSYQTTCATVKPTVSKNSIELLAMRCKGQKVSWTRCFENNLYKPKGRDFGPLPHYVHRVNSSQKAEVSPTSDHRVRIPSTALQRSRGEGSEDEVVVVSTVINSTFFELSPTPKRGKGRALPIQPTHMPGTVLGGLVLVVRAGDKHVANLPQPVQLFFNYSNQVLNGTCVFWEESGPNGTGRWSTDGCDTSNTGAEFVCSCNHLSFFAVLVNPVLSVDKRNAVTLSYITYVGSALSVVFTIISLIIYICIQRRRPEKAIGVHMQLTAALLCLHLSFLLCCLWVWLFSEREEDWVCRGLGLFLHWSLLATLCWTVLEGFHLYLLLVRVFNIYVRRYLLKLSLVGWGLPSLTVLVCGISGVYGKYSLEVRDGNNHNSTAPICWISSSFPQRLLVSFITTVAFPCLVVLYNSCMLGLVVFKLWGLRRDHGGSSAWKKMNKETGSRLWKDSATVLGLSCVLGLPWGLMSTTYVSLPGTYVFTILNSLQGVFMFLWSLALTCKSRSDYNSSIRDPSSQKMMTTSFNN